MMWTKEAPTKSGFYWWRGANKNALPVQVVITPLAAIMCGPGVFVAMAPPLKKSGAWEWAGPLTPPGDTASAGAVRDA